MSEVGRRIALCLVAAFGIASTAPAKAQILDFGTVAGAAILSESVKSLIDKARLAATSVLADGRNSGNYLLVRGADELNAYTDNLIRMFGDQMNQTVGSLSRENQQLLIRLDSATKSIEGLAKKAYRAKDTLVVDLRSALAELPFTKETLILQRIGGLTQIFGETDYIVDLIGSYYGNGTDDVRTELSLFVDEKPISFRAGALGVHQAQLRIASKDLAPYFDDRKVRILPGRLHVRHRVKSGFIFASTREKTYEVKVHFVLLPRYAGQIQIAWDEEVLGWRSIGSDSRSATGGDNHCRRNCRDHRGQPYEVAITVSGGNKTVQVRGDQRITAILSCSPIPGHNGFDERRFHRVEDDGRRAVCAWQGRSHPSTWQIVVSREEWNFITSKRNATKVDAYFDKWEQIRVGKQAKNARIVGMLSTGESIDVLLDQKSADPRVEFHITQGPDDGLVASFRVRRPPSLDE